MSKQRGIEDQAGGDAKPEKVNAIRGRVPLAVRYGYEDALRLAQRARIGYNGRRITHDGFVGAIMLELMSWPRERLIAMVRRRAVELQRLEAGFTSLEAILAGRPGIPPDEMGPAPGARVEERPLPKTRGGVNRGA